MIERGDPTSAARSSVASLLKDDIRGDNKYIFMNSGHKEGSAGHQDQFSGKISITWEDLRTRFNAIKQLTPIQARKIAFVADEDGRQTSPKDEENQAFANHFTGAYGSVRSTFQERWQWIGSSLMLVLWK